MVMLSEIIYERLASVTMATTNPIPIHFPDYTKGESDVRHTHIILYALTRTRVHIHVYIHSRDTCDHGNGLEVVWREATPILPNLPSSHLECVSQCMQGSLRAPTPGMENGEWKLNLHSCSYIS